MSGPATPPRNVEAVQCGAFKKPGGGRLEARFVLSDEEIATIRELTAHGKSINRVDPVEFTDRDGQVIASIDKTIYVRRK